MFESVLFSEVRKSPVCYVVTCAAIAGCRTYIVDGPCMVAVCVLFHTAIVEAQIRIICEILTLIGTVQSYRPSLRPLVAAIGHITSNLPIRLTEVSLLFKLPPKSVQSP